VVAVTFVGDGVVFDVFEDVVGDGVVFDVVEDVVGDGVVFDVVEDVVGGGVVVDVVEDGVDGVVGDGVVVVFGSVVVVYCIFVDVVNGWLVNVEDPPPCVVVSSDVDAVVEEHWKMQTVKSFTMTQRPYVV